MGSPTTLLVVPACKLSYYSPRLILPYSGRESKFLESSNRLKSTTTEEVRDYEIAEAIN